MIYQIFNQYATRERKSPAVISSRNFFLLIIVLLFYTFSFLVISSKVFASTTNGTIDSTYHYAWGENVGWVDFGSTTGSVHITDSALSGSIYGENIGWIDLSTIANTNAGILSGYAWGENVGWVDFSNVTIGTDGVFSGGAYGENIGWITFGTGDNKVVTDWRPLSARPRSSSGSTLAFRNNLLAQQQALRQPILNSSRPSTKSYNFGLATLKNGSKGEPVKELQRFLNVKLNLNLVVDGKLGPKTIAVIKKWQKNNGLVSDGLIGPKTKAKMNASFY